MFSINVSIQGKPSGKIFADFFSHALVDQQAAVFLFLSLSPSLAWVELVAGSRPRPTHLWRGNTCASLSLSTVKPEDGSYSSLDRRVTQNIVDSSCWFCAFVLMCILYIDFLDLSLCFLRRFLLWVIGDWLAASSVWPKRREWFFLSSPLWICQSPCPCHRCCLTEEE